MPRWEPNALDRLRDAAFELFAEQGFDRTTVAAIAQRAGLTQRTFFNYFTDKREVLFGFSSAFQEQVMDQLAASVSVRPSLEAVVHSLQAVTTAMFTDRQSAVKRRHEIVESNPELREREDSKLAALTDAIADALQLRGVDPTTAVISASSGIVVQQVATRQWMQPDEHRPLDALFDDALRALRSTVRQRSDRPHPVRPRDRPGASAHA